jgi:replicative DNA helicase
MKGLETGIEQIDRGLRGLKDGKLYCICSPAEEGCTNLIAQTVMGLATRDNSVLLFSLEKDRRTMFQMLFDIYWQMCDADAQFDDIERRHLMLYKMGKLPIWIEDISELSYASIQATIQRICLLNKHAIEVIVVDNLTLMKTDFAVSSLEYAIMANMYLLKMIAKKQKIPVLFFSEGDNIIANDTYLDKYVSFNILKEPIKNLKFC